MPPRYRLPPTFDETGPAHGIHLVSVMQLGAKPGKPEAALRLSRSTCNRLPDGNLLLRRYGQHEASASTAPGCGTSIRLRRANSPRPITMILPLNCANTDQPWLTMDDTG
jgi:hypothetical protein